MGTWTALGSSASTLYRDPWAYGYPNTVQGNSHHGSIRNTDVDANAPLTADVSRSFGHHVRQHTHYRPELQIQVSYLTV